METGKQFFHSDTQGLHLLFEPFLINEEKGGLLPGYIFIAIMCALERGLSYYMEYHQHKEALQSPARTTGQRISQIIARTVLYSIVTTLRLLYMLVCMYFNTGLFILVVSSLTFSQLFIEIIKSNNNSNSQCNKKTGPFITKFQCNNKGYSDLSEEPSSANEDEDEEEYDGHHDPPQNSKIQYDIPTIIISNEKSCCASTNDEQEENRAGL